MISPLPMRSSRSAKSRILRAIENSNVAFSSAWVSSLRTSVAEAPEANCATAVATSLMLPANVSLSMPGDAAACGVCACEEREKANPRLSQVPRRATRNLDAPAINVAPQIIALCRSMSGELGYRFHGRDAEEQLRQG